MISSRSGCVGQPALAGPQQLVDLVRRDPVVLGVVEHRQQHVQVVQRVGQPQRRRSASGRRSGSRPTRGAPRPAGPGRPSTVQPSGSKSRSASVGAAPAGQRRDRDLQRDRRGRRAPAGPRSRRAARVRNTSAQRHGQQAGRGVRAVVDVLAEREASRRASAPCAASRRRVDLQQQRRGAALVGRLRVEDVRGAGGQVERAAPGRGACAAGSPRSVAGRWVVVMVSSTPPSSRPDLSVGQAVFVGAYSRLYGDGADRALARACPTAGSSATSARGPAGCARASGACASCGARGRPDRAHHVRPFVAGSASTRSRRSRSTTSCPASPVLSFGTAGCNLGLPVLPELGHLQVAARSTRWPTPRRPEAIAETAARARAAAVVAFTYNDPVIFMEYAIDVADACRERGIRPSR